MRPLALALAVSLCAGFVPPPAAPPAAWRDQAYVVSPEAAAAAVAVLGRHGAVWQLCEPCGDAEPTLAAFDNAYAVPWDGDPAMRVVMLDGQGVDLAYVFVPLGPSGDAANAALLVGLAVSGVSPTLRAALPVGDEDP